MKLLNLFSKIKSTALSWKEKALHYAKEKRKQEKKTKELTISRDKWKAKFEKSQKQNEELKNGNY
jgi:hypothetical protein